MTKITAVAPTNAVSDSDAFLEEILTRTGGEPLSGARLCAYRTTTATRAILSHGARRRTAKAFSCLRLRNLGEYHRTAAIDTFGQEFRPPSDRSCGLHGARLVTAVETEEGRRWAEAKIKQLTGGDEIAARFMRQDFFEYRPTFKLAIAGNHKPALRSVDEAI